MTKTQLVIDYIVNYYGYEKSFFVDDLQMDLLYERDTDISRSTIRKAIKQLEQLGVIKKARDYRRTFYYELVGYAYINSNDAKQGLKILNEEYQTGDIVLLTDERVNKIAVALLASPHAVWDCLIKMINYHELDEVRGGNYGFMFRMPELSQ